MLKTDINVITRYTGYRATNGESLQYRCVCASQPDSITNHVVCFELSTKNPDMYSVVSMALCDKWGTRGTRAKQGILYFHLTEEMVGGG